MTIGALGSTDKGGIQGQRLTAQGTGAALAALAWLRAQLAAQEAHLFFYVPFFLLFGDWFYFWLREEPSLWLALAGGLGGLVLVWARSKSAVLFLCGFLLMGFATAKIREVEVATPVLHGPVSDVNLSGWISNFADRAQGARLLEITLDEITGVPEAERPLRVRVYAEDSAWLEVGDYIKAKAYLSPLPRPVSPGAFDYARNQYFSSVGAQGRLVGKIELVPGDVPWRFEYRRIFRALRLAINERIFAVIPGALGHFGASMVTGDRFGIGDEVTISTQISGLAHLIGVAGLHMSIVGGFAFWIVRALLALIPALALHYPIKKWAAMAALGVCLMYMLLADAGSRTERSFIMTAIFFIAILLDRPALSMRNLALSACIVLLLTPEECLSASFQMSYSAVMAIIAFHAWYRDVRGVHEHAKSWLGRFWDHAKEMVIRGAGISIVSGTGTGIAAAYQFGRLSPYTMFANGLALPVAEVALLPPAVVGVAAMPFGLEWLPLKVMHFGLWFTMLISDWIATWPGANLVVAKPNVFGILVMVIGSGVVCVGFGKFRLLGWPTMLLGLLLCGVGQKPVLLVEDRAANVAVLNTKGEYVFASSKNKFTSAKWLENNGETVTMLDAVSRPGWDCTGGDCVTDMLPVEVSYLHEKSGNGLYCPPTPIIIADFPLHRQCREAKLVIDRIDVWRNGSYAVYLEGKKLRTETARGEQGDRPWAYDSRKAIKPQAEINTSATGPQDGPEP